jgi:hypothetical protein
MDPEPRHNLFMQEGALWHLEQPTPPKPELPSNSKELLTAWAAGLEHGKWRLLESGEPVFRYSAPSGWLVSLTLERTGRVASDEFSRINLLVVIAEGQVASRMLVSRGFDNGPTKVVVPLKSPRWEPATK